MNQTHISLNERLQKYAVKDLKQLYNDFHLEDGGLNKEQVCQMQKKYGINQIIYPMQKKTIRYCLKKAFINPFSVILFILAILSFLTDFCMLSNFSKNGMSVIILIMLFISGTLRFIQERKADYAIEHLPDETKETVVVYRNNSAVEISAEEVVVGDLVMLDTGNRIPADMRLIEAQNLVVSQSVLTGESNLLEKNAKTIADSTHLSLERFSNVGFMGSHVISGKGKGIVLAVGEDTVYGSYIVETQREKGDFDQGANSIARVFIQFMLMLVPIVFIISGITKGDWLTSFLFSVSVAVGLTPELLPLVINVCLTKGSKAMWKKQTIVKNINAMQRFGSMDVLCVDKTGTLTGDEIQLEYYLDILGNESQEVLENAYINSFYCTGNHNSLDQAILKYAEVSGKQIYFSKLPEKMKKIGELPFDYERKCVSILLEKNENMRCLITKGDVKNVYKRCRYVQYKDEIIPIDTSDSSSVDLIVDEMTEDGMKVLAIAYKTMDYSCFCLEDESDLILLGYIVFFDAPKESAKSALKKLQSLNVPVKVLTGDQRKATVSICRRLGISVTHTITGDEIDKLTEDEQLLAVEKNVVFAELTPMQKSKIIHILRENGHVVGYLGDGMNDLAAMTAADVGISVDTAVQAVKESADVILLKKDLNVLEQGILEGRRAFANMSKYIRITASSNFGNILSVVIASAFLPFLPMTAVQFLLLNLLYDGLCITLPWDNVDQDIYKRPSEWSGKTLGRFMRFFGPLSSLFDLITFIFLYFILCPLITGGSFSELSQTLQGQYIEIFHTAWFLESLWTQTLILHLLRTRQRSIIKNRAAGIVWRMTVIGLFILTFMVYTPIGSLFGLTPLPIYYFIYLVLIIFVYMALVTVAKSLYIRKYNTLS